MLNQLVLVGRIAKLPNEKNKESVIITLAVPRSFKNKDDEYEVDTLPCSLFGNVGSATLEYCKVGDMVGIKGRLAIKKDKIVIVAEKVTFLSSTSKE